MLWHIVTQWRGNEGVNCRKQWVASTLHTTSEHVVSSIITADAHTSADSSGLNWRPPADLNGLVSLAAKKKSGYSARVPSHFKAVYHITQYCSGYSAVRWNLLRYYIHTYIYIYGPCSSVGIANVYGLYGPGSKVGGDEIFRPSWLVLGPTQPPVIYRCPRRNVPVFGRVFLMLKCTDITQNAFIQIWTVTEIMAREKCGLLVVPRTLPGKLMLARPALLVQLCSSLIPKCAVSRMISVLQYYWVFMCHVKCLEP